MGSSRWKLPPQRDFAFYQRRKHDHWRSVETPDPALEVPVADSHTHLHSLPDPAWELARCAANNVDLLCDFADPSDDLLDHVFELATLAPSVQEVLEQNAISATPPKVLFALGVHPHNADAYSDQLEAQLRELLLRPEVRVLGEIGLDYYYDNSEREAQRDVFRRQLRVAHEMKLPVALHVRSGASADADAHGEAYDILCEEGFPKAGTLLHCCALSPDRIQPWIEADCSIAYGGALTFKDAEDAREGARLVPTDRLMLETDAPYMTPEPMRGATCTPSHVIFTAERLAEVRGVEPGEERKAFLEQVHGNTVSFLDAKGRA